MTTVGGGDAAREGVCACVLYLIDGRLVNMMADYGITVPACKGLFAWNMVNMGIPEENDIIKISGR